MSMVTTVALVAGLGFAAYSSVEIPAFDAEINDQTTTVYYADPNDPAGRGPKMGDYPGVRREIIEGCAEIPQYVKDAVVASEDRSFYSNSGVDPRGIARALYNNLAKKGGRQGASTLTQQYVDNYYGGTRHGYLGKAQEALLAVKISKEQSKDTILCNYLNTIFWGRGKTHGIQAAAQAYFAKDAKDLTVTQAALLAGIIPSPINWDPANNPEKAEQRWKRTLGYMVDGKDLKFHLTAAEKNELVFPPMCPTEDEAGVAVVVDRDDPADDNGGGSEVAAAEQDGDCVIWHRPEPAYEGPNGYLMEMARQEAAKLVGVSEAELMRGGYTVITTVDQRMQDMAIESGNGLLDGTLNNNPDSAPSQCNPNIEPAEDEPACAGMLRVAMVTLDPSDGSIRAMYSGPDYVKDQYNRVTRGLAQAGSTFKPFTLVAALQQGHSLDSVYSGVSPRTFPVPGSKDWKVVNFGGSSYGDINLMTATANSVNTVYAELNIEIGPEATNQVARDAGISTQLSPLPANVLGSDAVHPLEMAQAYGVFATQGKKATPHIVARVVSPTGRVWAADTETKRVFDSGVMADTVAALQGPVQGGSASEYVKPIGRTIAGKTGTSSYNKSAWFVGFTTDLVTAVALSQEGPGGSEVTITPWGGLKQITGGSWPAALWADYMAGCGGKKTKKACSGGVLGLPEYSQDTKFPPPPHGGTASTPEPSDDENSGEMTYVPSVANKYEWDASAALAEAGFQPNVVYERSNVPADRVTRVEPREGSELPYGSIVTIYVSSGPGRGAAPGDAPEDPAGAGFVPPPQ